MREKKSFVIKIEPLHYDIHVLYLFNENDIRRYSSKYLDGIELNRIAGSVAQFFPLEGSDGRQWAGNGQAMGRQWAGVMDLYTEISKNDFYSLSNIVHEVVHAVLGYFRYYEIDRHCDDNEEFYCYHVAYIFRRILEEIFNKK